MNATERKKSTVKTSRIFKVFFDESKKYPWRLFVIFVCLIGTSVVSALAPLYYKDFFDALAGEVVARTAFTALVLGLVLKGVGWALWRPITLISNWIQARVEADLSNAAFANILQHSYEFFTNSFVGSLTRKVSRFAAAYETIFDQFAYSLIPLLVTTTTMLVVIFSRSKEIGFALLIWCGILIYLNYLVIQWKQKYEEERAAADTKVGATASDAFTNNTTIKLFSAVHHEKSLFGQAIESLRRIRLFTWNINEAMRAVQGFLTLVIEVVVMFGSYQLYQKGLLTLGDFVLFQAYILTLANSLWGFGWVLKALYQAFADAKEMVEILDKPFGVQDVPGAGMLRVTKGKIEFTDVSFNFNETRKVLDGFSLSINPGEKVAFIGPSGAGKTTVTKLLFRFHDVTEGTIFIDGQDISKVTQDSLRNAIALVPQEPILFHRSLKDNIRYGRLDATDEEVIEAAKKARCHEFIAALPDGYDTMVGERGIKLSGGERQRVAIARAILKDAPILVLDEATSSLDSESEHLIQDALRTLMEGKTVIVIAHRLSTIIKMDRIIVIEDGNIRAMGTHNELLAKDELYKKLWSIQAGGFLKEEE
ncbi:MAG: ABC transporter ATP-binding protein [Patescibacteria group bacterium]